jgi:acetyl esterase/lipase
MATISQLEETRAFNAELERILADMPSAHTLPPEVTRRARREGRGFFPPPVFLANARDVDIPTRSGGIKARVIAPQAAPTGVYLHIHGGGWTFGDHDMQDPLLQEIVDATGMTAVSAGYRLAPEHPFPAGPDDCEDAALWLLDRGAAELGAPSRHAIGGESAGAHLSVLTLLRLRDRHVVLSTPLMHWFSDCFLGRSDREARRDPEISPLYADLHDMPPALFQVGTADPLLDDSLFMDARWRSAGCESTLQVYEEAAHGFTAFGIGVSREARQEQCEFLRAV